MAAENTTSEQHRSRRFPVKSLGTHKRAVKGVYRSTPRLRDQIFEQEQLVIHTRVLVER